MCAKAAFEKGWRCKMRADGQGGDNPDTSQNDFVFAVITPASSAAKATIILKVEPGGY